MADRTHPPGGKIGESIQAAYAALSDAAWALWNEKRSRNLDDYPGLIEDAEMIVQWHAKAWAEEIRIGWEEAGKPGPSSPGLSLALTRQFIADAGRGLALCALQQAPHRKRRQTMPRYELEE